jgi:hypothetical protein
MAGHTDLRSGSRGYILTYFFVVEVVRKYLTVLHTLDSTCILFIAVFEAAKCWQRYLSVIVAKV